MILPPKRTGKPDIIPADQQRIIIIGANGAGKSRFTERLAESLPDKAFRLSALKAMYDRSEADPSPNSIDTLYHNHPLNAISKSDSGETSQLERLISLLMQDEMLNLLGYKLQASTDKDTHLPTTNLDRVIKLWQKIFPGNKVLIENGRILFSNSPSAMTEDGDYAAPKRSWLRLSAGEQAVIYYIGAILYAPQNAVIFVDSPELFLHPSILQEVWNHIEELRPDCTMVYTTHDLEFASSRENASVVWVREFDPENKVWDYDLLPPRKGIPDEVYLAIIGARKPVLFIEGDGVHSIDCQLYPLLFKNHTVKPLGSCNKVIEATRSFNDLGSFHHMDSYGIVDRDRRDPKEVAYLRGKKIMVPDVAEIENLLMLEEVVRTVAHRKHKNEDKVFSKVKHALMGMFRTELHQQALLHTRHRVKRNIEFRVDGRFTNIGMFEKHINSLLNEVNPRGLYEGYCREFQRYLNTEDYKSILRVFNQKAMIPGSNVAGLCGLRSKEDYLRTILEILREDKADAERIRKAMLSCFALEDS